VQRFKSGYELVIAMNPAFALTDSDQRDLFAREYKKSSALYHQGQPDFDQLLYRVGKHLDSMSRRNTTDRKQSAVLNPSSLKSRVLHFTVESAVLIRPHY
jgi:hypothetical protein